MRERETEREGGGGENVFLHELNTCVWKFIISCVYVCSKLQVIIGTHTVMADGGLVFSFISLIQSRTDFLLPNVQTKGSEWISPASTSC